MDNLRNLSTSLPRARRGNDRSHELLASFKAAALDVTNLYRTAAAEQVRARSAGYQDALDDILAFLDRENLGLMDGEGWRVRQWATERLDEGPHRQAGSEADEEEAPREEAEEARSSSPEAHRKPGVPITTSELAEAPSPQRAATAEPAHIARQSSPQQHSMPTQNDFTFRSQHAYPTNHDREGMELDSSQANTTASTSSSTSTVRITPRPHRNRHNRHRQNRENGATINLNLASAAGSKRKMPYPDFFDISGINFEGQNHDRKDSGGRGGKRSRHV